MSTIHLRSAHPDDYDDFCRLFPELDVPDPVPTRERFETSILPDSTVVLAGNAVVGVVWARRRGESLHVVYVIVHPAHRRRGVGRMLLEETARRGHAQGLARWMLNVKPENVAARKLYERMGMRQAFASVSVKLPWASVARLPPSPAGLVVAPLVEDARFEEALALSPGELAAVRALPGRVVHGAFREGAPVGLAAFDPDFPGVAPLRVADVAFVRPLLESVAPFARPEKDHLYAFVEGDEALELALLGVGGTAALRVLRMAGPIPDSIGQHAG